MISERNATLTLHSRRKLEGGFYETCRTRFYSPSTWKSLPAQFEIPRLVLRAWLKAMQFCLRSSSKRTLHRICRSDTAIAPSQFSRSAPQINGGAGHHYVFQAPDGRTRRAVQMVCVRAESYIPLQRVLGTLRTHIGRRFRIRVLSDSGLVAKAKHSGPYGTSVCSAHSHLDPVCRAFRMHRKMKILQIFENILSWTSKREYPYIATYHSDMLAGVSPQSFVCGFLTSAPVRLWNPVAVSNGTIRPDTF
ncbi:Hypothetical_protein [Hexamita inflata]|uniref:Hypothetical_protein n=1 Tax=Hexamita inflata TaxID=28002 RepID=A0AA86P722_9EUKA|nr:Hypothetical protein HINF_LOCUS19748 [Hexamita inflata]